MRDKHNWPRLIQLVAGNFGVRGACILQQWDRETAGPVDVQSIGLSGRRWRIDQPADWLVTSLPDKICRLRVWQHSANLSHDCRRIFEDRPIARLAAVAAIGTRERLTDSQIARYRRRIRRHCQCRRHCSPDMPIQTLHPPPEKWYINKI